MRKFTFSMPPDSIIPVAVGALMVWTFVSMYQWLGYTHCAPWSLIQSAPQNGLYIVGTLKDNIYLQSNDGTIYCNTQNQWKPCLASLFTLEHKDAPTWLYPYFSSIPEKGAITQLTHTGDLYVGTSYLALLENHQIWSCPDDFNSKMAQIIHSGAVMLLVLPAAIVIWCIVSFMKAFIEYGSPTLWDFSGRGTKIK